MYGRRIRELRTERGMTQAELAAKLSLAQITVSKYEREALDLGTETLIALCRIFEVSADFLLGLEDEAGARQYR